jgi:RNA polymerase sigma factor (TIGR02999 family)
MGPELPGEVTRLLRRVDSGDREAINHLLPLVYGELRAMAGACLSGERRDHTLQPTALVNEAYLKLAAKDDPHWTDRRHFYRAAAVVMRSILINHARERRRQKRGGGEMKKIPLDDHLAVFEERALDLVALDEALEKLETIDARQTEMIELRFFAGLSIKEAAEVMGVSERTLQADWSLARAWLLREMDEV